MSLLKKKSIKIVNTMLYSSLLIKSTYVLDNDDTIYMHAASFALCVSQFFMFHIKHLDITVHFIIWFLGLHLVKEAVLLAASCSMPCWVNPE